MLTANDQTVGGEAIIDADVSNTPVFVRSSVHTTSLAGSLVLNNVRLTNVPVAVGVLNGPTLLAGGTTTIESWVQGNVYAGARSARKFVQGPHAGPAKARSLLDARGKVFCRIHPQYEGYAVDQFVSARDLGATGDGRTDDTASLQRIFDEVRLKRTRETPVLTMALTVRGKEGHIPRPWHVLCDRYTAHSRGHPTRWGGVERHSRWRPRVCGCAEPAGRCPRGRA